MSYNIYKDLSRGSIFAIMRNCIAAGANKSYTLPNVEQFMKNNNKKTPKDYTVKEKNP